MKLSDKVLNLLKDTGKPFETLHATDDYSSYAFEASIGEVTFYTLGCTFNIYGGTEDTGGWLVDIYSLDECTDEELLFIKLQEPHKGWKTHSEVLSIVEELILCN
jgi:hypothetical protein